MKNVFQITAHFYDNYYDLLKGFESQAILVLEYLELAVMFSSSIQNIGLERVSSVITFRSKKINLSSII